MAGPALLTKLESPVINTEEKTTYVLIDPDSEAEIRGKVTALATKVTEDKLGSKRFERFFKWSWLIKAVARLCHIAQCFFSATEQSRLCCLALLQEKVVS